MKAILAHLSTSLRRPSSWEKGTWPALQRTLTAWFFSNGETERSCLKQRAIKHGYCSDSFTMNPTLCTRYTPSGAAASGGSLPYLGQASTCPPFATRPAVSLCHTLTAKRWLARSGCLRLMAGLTPVDTPFYQSFVAPCTSIWYVPIRPFVLSR